MACRFKSPSMDPAALCSLGLLIMLLVASGGCIREEDRETGSPGGLFPELIPTVPTVPEPRETPALPTLPKSRSGSSPGFRNAQRFTPPEPFWGG